MESRVVRSVCLSAALLLGAFVLDGCQGLGSLLDAFGGRPEARVTGVGLDELTLDAATLVFDVEVSNPYSVPLPLVDLSYGLASGERLFLEGDVALDGTIAANGVRVLELPARIDFGALLAALDDVRPGAVVPYALEARVGVDAPGVGPLELPVRREGELPVPAVPDVELQSLSWDTLSMDEARATIALRIGNTNSFPIDLDALDYRLALGGSQVVSARLVRPTVLSAGGESVLEVPITFAPRQLGFAAFNMLTGSSGRYELGGTLNVDTPFGALALPFQQRGETAFRR